MFDHFFGNKSVRDYLEQVTKTGKRAHAYVWLGPRGMGKRTLARQWAQELLGDAAPIKRHPDFFEPRIRSKELPPIDAARAVVDFASHRPLCGGARVALLCGDDLTGNAQDVLLKTLEEPRTDLVLIITASEPDALSLTVRSRVHHLFFERLTAEDMEAFLQARSVTPALRARIAGAAAGIPAAALKFAQDKGALEEHERHIAGLCAALGGTVTDRMAWAHQFFPQSEKEAAHKRALACEGIALSERALHANILRGVLPASGALAALQEARGALLHNVAPQLVLENMLLSL